MLTVYIIIGCIIHFVIGNLVIGFMQATDNDYWITIDPLFMIAIIVFWPLYLAYKLLGYLAAAIQALGFYLCNKIKRG
jgi:hypothetical protein